MKQQGYFRENVSRLPSYNQKKNRKILLQQTRSFTVKFYFLSHFDWQTIILFDSWECILYHVTFQMGHSKFTTVSKELHKPVLLCVVRSWVLPSMNFNRNRNAEIYVLHIKSQVKTFATFMPMCTKSYLHTQRKYRNFYCTVPNSRKEHTCSNATFSCKSQEKSSVVDRRGKIWHCQFFLTTPSVLANEPEDSQTPEPLTSMARKSVTERAQRTRANAPTYSAPAGPSRASQWSDPSGPLEAAQSLSKGDSVRGAGPTAKVRAYVTAWVRASRGVERARSPQRGWQLPWERNIPRLPLPPAIPPAGLLPPSPARRYPGLASQRRPLTFQIVL